MIFFMRGFCGFLSHYGHNSLLWVTVMSTDFCMVVEGVGWRVFGVISLTSL